MAKGVSKKVMTDLDLKKKAVKLVIAHLKKKATEKVIGLDNLNEWVAEMDKLLQKPEFNILEYLEMRKSLNDVIERTEDEDMRFKLRDSWCSFGKALDKKVNHG
jgi:hypothetical protein